MKKKEDRKSVDDCFFGGERDYSLYVAMLGGLRVFFLRMTPIENRNEFGKVGNRAGEGQMEAQTILALRRKSNVLF